jgi:RNA polymerase sporulation-specific sigma factor
MHKYTPHSLAAQPSAVPRTRAPTGSVTTIDRAVQEHTGLIHAVIKRHGSGVLTYEEALQAGRIGLWRALLCYDPTRGLAFSTYAWVAIRRAIWREARQVRRGNRWQTEPDFPGSPPDEAADPTADVVTLVEQRELRAVLRDLIQQLSPRQRWVVVARYGLDGQPPRLRRQIGEQLNCSAEWVRQLEQTALAWLRHPTYSLHLRQLVGRNTTADYRHALALNAAWQRARKGRRR